MGSSSPKDTKPAIDEPLKWGIYIFYLVYILSIYIYIYMYVYIHLYT
jgi:hypothetical protein